MNALSFHADPGALVELAQLRKLALAGLVHDLQIRNALEQLRGGLTDDAVQGARALAAAEDQQRGRLAPPRRQREKRGPHRNSGHLKAAETSFPVCAK